jgi:hypothetical protein
MANHDWNRPCECSECRTTYQTHVCPTCNFNNKVSIYQDSKWVDDRRHGGGDYSFEIPTSPIKDLKCYDCGHLIRQVGFYSSVHEEFCVREQERNRLIQLGRVCVCCSGVEEIDYNRGMMSGKIELNTHNDRLLCGSCLVDTVKEELPDPTDKNNKYEFSTTTLSWVLVKVRIPCRTCEKTHLVNVSQQTWRKQCTKCYKVRK